MDLLEVNLKARQVGALLRFAFAGCWLRVP
jgi:hypothetical protein